MTTETFTGSLAVGASRFYSFTVNAGGTVSVTLASVTAQADGTTLTQPLEIGIGIPAGTGCRVAVARSAMSGLVTQLQMSAGTGVHCVRVSDTAGLPYPMRLLGPVHTSVGLMLSMRVFRNGLAFACTSSVLALRRLLGDGHPDAAERDAGHRNVRESVWPARNGVAIVHRVGDRDGQPDADVGGAAGGCRGGDRDRDSAIDRQRVLAEPVGHGNGCLGSAPHHDGGAGDLLRAGVRCGGAERRRAASQSACCIRDRSSSSF